MDMGVSGPLWSCLSGAVGKRYLNVLSQIILSVIPEVIYGRYSVRWGSATNQNQRFCDRLSPGGLQPCMTSGVPSCRTANSKACQRDAACASMAWLDPRSMSIAGWEGCRRGWAHWELG